MKRLWEGGVCVRERERQGPVISGLKEGLCADTETNKDGESHSCCLPSALKLSIKPAIGRLALCQRWSDGVEIEEWRGLLLVLGMLPPHCPPPFSTCQVDGAANVFPWPFSLLLPSQQSWQASAAAPSPFAVIVPYLLDHRARRSLISRQTRSGMSPLRAFHRHLENSDPAPPWGGTCSAVSLMRMRRFGCSYWAKGKHAAFLPGGPGWDLGDLFSERSRRRNSPGFLWSLSPFRAGHSHWPGGPASCKSREENSIFTLHLLLVSLAWGLKRNCSVGTGQVLEHILPRPTLSTRVIRMAAQSGVTVPSMTHHTCPA